MNWTNPDFGFHGPVDVCQTHPSPQNQRLSLTFSVTLDGPILANSNPLLEFHESSLGFLWEMAPAYMGASWDKRNSGSHVTSRQSCSKGTLTPTPRVLWERCVSCWAPSAKLAGSLDHPAVPHWEGGFPYGETMPTTMAFRLPLVPQCGKGVPNNFCLHLAKESWLHAVVNQSIVSAQRTVFWESILVKKITITTTKGSKTR